MELYRKQGNAKQLRNTASIWNDRIGKGLVGKQSSTWSNNS